MNGLLSPEGVFHEARIGHHNDLFRDLFPGEFSMNTEIDSWVYVTPDSIWCNKPLSQAQIDWIKRTNHWLYLIDLKLMSARDNIDY